MKSLAKQVSHWEKVVVPEIVLLVTEQEQMSQEIVHAMEQEFKKCDRESCF